MSTGRITVAVIGNGIIGHGVAQVFAMAGKTVITDWPRPATASRARRNIRASLADFAAHRLLIDRRARPGRADHRLDPPRRCRRGGSS